MKPAHLSIALAAAFALACGSGVPPQSDIQAEFDAIEAELDAAAGTQPPPVQNPDKSEKVKAWMIIVQGTAVEGEAHTMQGTYEAEGLPGSPAIFESATVEGLNPGFWIISPGVLEDKASAQQMATALGSAREGAYIKEVTIERKHVESVTCPDDPRCTYKPPVAAGWKTIIVFDYTDGMESEDWGYFTDTVIKRGKAAGIDAHWDNSDEYVNEVKVDGKKVGEVSVEPFIGELFGYVVAMEGKEPKYIQHQMVDDVIWQCEQYFGMKL